MLSCILFVFGALVGKFELILSIKQQSSYAIIRYILLDIFCCRICCYIDAKADGHEKQEFQAQKAAEPRQGLWGFCYNDYKYQKC